MTFSLEVDFICNKGLFKSRYILGIVKTTTPFVNATTLVIWDFTRDVGVSEIKVISWRAGRGPLYEPFMAGEGLYYTRAGSRGADIGLMSYFGEPNFRLLLG